jgi:putative hemolysin
MIGLVLTFVVLAALSMTLSAVEGAFYFCKKRRLGHLTGAQNPRAVVVNRYLQDPLLLLMPVHIGTYTAHVGMTVCVTALLIDRIAHWSLLAAFSVMVVYLLAFRLTLPYALVRRSPERALLLLLPAFDAYARALHPLVRVLRQRAAPEALLATEQRAAASAAPPAPVHDPDEERVAEAVRRFSITQVREVMTPRPDIVAMRATGTVGDARRVVNESKYSRIPIYGQDLDDIVGVVTVRDLVAFDGDPSAPVQTVARKTHMVPDAKKIADLLKELQANRSTFAVVIDEYGGTKGVISMEDILEELVGEIEDEFDLDVEPISVEGDGAVVVAGRVNLERLELALNDMLSEEGVPASTVGGLVTAAFGRIPHVGEKVDFRGYTVEVLDAGHKRVNRVRFRRQPMESA